MVTEEYKGLYAPIREHRELLNDIAHETALAPPAQRFSGVTSCASHAIESYQRRNC
ncbi:hypothetical protein SSYM_1277 [Serratia symbiotica str. Tucson]|uniref:Uncharacterized protein n=2 Tax=Serratia symbiotica TaxID=138074 RepID=E9CLX6_9GAMM|nr:hypothetical protein SSYM_1277 [Serratia symbiotica str. Tucson]BBI93101.1 uncharacterized protein SSYIS1_41120 [Serratia symbiotica]